MGNATQKIGGPLLNGDVPPGMSYDGTTWTFPSIAFTGGMTVPYRIATDTTAALAADYAIVCNKGTAMSVTLPAVATVPGKVYCITNKGAGVVTIDPASSEAIGNGTTLGLNQWQSAIIMSDGAQWLILG